jgi:hypothetical protein
MSTNTKRAPGRPKKTPAQPKVQAAPVSNDVEIKYHEPKKVNRGWVFKARKAGILYMLPQSGITVFDKEKNQVREIRYCENMPSIYVDEQGDHAKRGSIIFNEGVLLVPPTKPQLADYLMAHPMNIANGGNSFELINNAAKKTKTLEDEFNVVDAVSAVRDKAISELLPVAMAYGIRTDQSPSDIRYDLLVHAKSNPSAFMSTFDSPMVKTAAYIRQATDFQILRKKNDGYYWFDSNGLIVACPVGQDPVDVMTRFCMTERGASVLMEVKDRLAKMD